MRGESEMMGVVLQSRRHGEIPVAQRLEHRELRRARARDPLGPAGCSHAIGLVLLREHHLVDAPAPVFARHSPEDGALERRAALALEHRIWGTSGPRRGACSQTCPLGRRTCFGAPCSRCRARRPGTGHPPRLRPGRRTTRRPLRTRADRPLGLHPTRSRRRRARSVHTSHRSRGSRGTGRAPAQQPDSRQRPSPIRLGCVADRERARADPRIDELFRSVARAVVDHDPLEAAERLTFEALVHARGAYARG